MCKTPDKFTGLILFSHQVLPKKKGKRRKLNKGYTRIAIIG
jgi:hypothetical protein